MGWGGVQSTMGQYFSIVKKFRFWQDESFKLCIDGWIKHRTPSAYPYGVV